jgi:hypothetical protein
MVPLHRRYHAGMKTPPDPNDGRPGYWIRGERTRLHRYFYPSDDRAGLALMLLIAGLGLLAFGIGLTHVSRSSHVHRADLVLIGIGFVVAAVGLYQASRLR